jgi:hypothetical protein
MKNKQYTMKRPGEDAVKYGLNLPEKFLGEDSGQTQPAKNGVSAHHEQLKELARNYDTHGEFADAALSLPGVEDDDKLVLAIADPNGLYQELRNDAD